MYREWNMSSVRRWLLLWFLIAGCGGDAEAPVETDAGLGADQDAPFSCGDKTCAADQICRFQSNNSGVCPPDFSDAGVCPPGCPGCPAPVPDDGNCDPIPTECESDLSCACLKMDGCAGCPGAGTACEEVDGHFELYCSNC